MTDGKSLPLIFFVDRCLGGKATVVAALRNAGETAYAHDEIFLPDTEDAIWLPQVAQDGWIILTADRGIQKNELEKQAVEASCAKLFVLVARNLVGAQRADVIMQALPRIKHHALHTQPPFIASISRYSKISILR